MGGGLLGLGRFARAADTAPGLTDGTGLPVSILLVLLTGTGLGVVLAVWHLIVGIGALRLRNWARYNLIVLCVLQLPGVLLVSLTWLAAAILPTTILSVLLLGYLFRPSVARVFELGLGPATLPVAEADSIERVLGTRRWT
jgi:hypothetical protein